MPLDWHGMRFALTAPDSPHNVLPVYSAPNRPSQEADRPIMGKQISSMKPIPVPGRLARTGYRARHEPYLASAMLVAIPPYTGFPLSRVSDSHALRQFSGTGIAWEMPFTATMNTASLLAFTCAIQQ